MHTTRPALATTALLVEAESFDNHGGWTLDSQVEREMGSPYLLAQVPGPSVPERGWRSGLDGSAIIGPRSQAPITHRYSAAHLLLDRLEKENTMATFGDATANAIETEQALRGLAHATRRIDDPSQIYGMLGSLSQATASLSQALHQLASYHDKHEARADATIIDPKQTGAAYRVSWDLHRAAEMLASIQKSIDSAHQSEATIVYQPRDLATRRTSRTQDGLSL